MFQKQYRYNTHDHSVADRSDDLTRNAHLTLRNSLHDRDQRDASARSFRSSIR